MNNEAFHAVNLPSGLDECTPGIPSSQRDANVSLAAPTFLRFPARPRAVDTDSRIAELFYLQKQVQTQTPMMIVLEDGEQIEGCIEWWDRNSIKVRGRAKTLIYKSAVKYMYKVVEAN